MILSKKGEMGVQAFWEVEVKHVKPFYVSLLWSFPAQTFREACSTAQDVMITVGSKQAQKTFKKRQEHFDGYERLP